MCVCDPPCQWVCGADEMSRVRRNCVVCSDSSPCQVWGGPVRAARARRGHTGIGVRFGCAVLLWLKLGSVGHAVECMGGVEGFDATRGFPGEGPEGRRSREARGFLKAGTTNVTSWKSFMD